MTQDIYCSGIDMVHILQILLSEIYTDFENKKEFTGFLKHIK